MRPFLAVAFACALAACDTTSAVQPPITAETARANYAAGDAVEVTIANRTNETVGLFFLCTSALERRAGGGWTVVYRPDCSAIFEAATEIEPDSEYVGTLTLPASDVLDVGAEYRFRFSPVYQAASESASPYEAVTSPFVITSDR